VLSGDGSRLFWRGYVYDADLNELGSLGTEIYATTLHGDLAFGDHQVFNTHSGVVFYRLPVSSTVMSVSGDQEKLFIFDPGAGDLVVIPMSEIAPVPGPAVDPDPADGATLTLPVDRLAWSVSPFALSYEVYFGDDYESVKVADPNSPEYLGNVVVSDISLTAALDLGTTYYWRVDIVGFAGVVTGEVWSFHVAPIVVEPKSISVKGVAGATNPDIQLVITAGGAVVDWTLTESSPWLVPDHTQGTTPDTVLVVFDTAGLAPGTYTTEILFQSGDTQFSVPVELELIQMALTKMVTDFGDHYVYGLQRGSGSFDDAFLLFINTDTEQIEKVLPVGANTTDMAINHGEGRLYVTNWLGQNTQVVNLQTQELLPPLSLGPDVYKLNAGRPGRIYYEEEDQWIDIRAVDTATGMVVGQINEREGDGEIDPTGTYYYHCDNNISNAHIRKLDISTDIFTQVAGSLQHPYGSRNLVLSGDGSRLFWRGYVYDADLNELGSLGTEIYGTTLHGDLAFGASEVFDAHNGSVVYTLPVSSTVMSVSGDQEKLFIFDPGAGDFIVIPMSEFLPLIFMDGFETGDTSRWSSSIP
jgi:DNA-binding beta-propeller fold protein YncE